MGRDLKELLIKVKDMVPEKNKNKIDDLISSVSVAAPEMLNIWWGEAGDTIQDIVFSIDCNHTVKYKWQIEYQKKVFVGVTV